MSWKSKYKNFENNESVLQNRYSLAQRTTVVSFYPRTGMRLPPTDLSSGQTKLLLSSNPVNNCILLKIAISNDNAWKTNEMHIHQVKILCESPIALCDLYGCRRTYIWNLNRWKQPVLSCITLRKYRTGFTPDLDLA